MTHVSASIVILARHCDGSARSLADFVGEASSQNSSAAL